MYRHYFPLCVHSVPAQRLRPKTHRINPSGTVGAYVCVCNVLYTLYMSRHISNGELLKSQQNREKVASHLYSSRAVSVHRLVGKRYVCVVCLSVGAVVCMCALYTLGEQCERVYVCDCFYARAFHSSKT